MTGGSAESSPSAAAAGESTGGGWRAPRRVALVATAAVVVAAVLLLAGRYWSGRSTREYEAVLKQTLDRIVTAQEGFFYDSAHYARTLSALPTVKLPASVHADISATPRSWSGVATHDRLPRRRCVVWVVTPPPTLPEPARAPENETKPLCFDSAQLAR